MNTSSEIKIEKPQIIQALLSGFNTIANKPYLMLLPIILDLFLWFGPVWRVDTFFQPFIQGLSGLPGMNKPEFNAALESLQSAWQDLIANFNLAITLRTLPIGIPSLMVSKNPLLNPLGRPPVFNLTTNMQILAFWSIFLLIGFFLGSIYFRSISRQVIQTQDDGSLKSILWTFFQILMMPILLILILIIIIIPVIFLITLITLISPAISQFFIFISGIILLWTVMPLIFTPHGIFLYKQNLIAAMMTSINVVRVSMGQTAWFIFASFILIEGLDKLWQAPTVDNWYLMIGILGRAFVVTAVIASSFHYFIDATKFTQTLINENIKSA